MGFGASGFFFIFSLLAGIAGSVTGVGVWASDAPMPSPVPLPSFLPDPSPLPTPAVGARKICQVTGEFDAERREYTINRTWWKYGIYGAELGVPVEHGGKLRLLFGETISWGRKRDYEPERRGGSSASTSDADPEDCLKLEFATPANNPHLFLETDFRGPGKRSVLLASRPSGAFSAGGKIWAFYSSGQSGSVIPRAFLASSSDQGRSFRVERPFSESKFILNAPFVADRGVYVWGAGREYRRSNPVLAFLPLNSAGAPGEARYFAGMTENAQPRWSPREKDARALFDQPCVGELSVEWNRALDRWLMLYHCGRTTAGLPRGIHARLAENPWGPWSEPRVVFRADLDGGECQYIHVDWRARRCDAVHDQLALFGWNRSDESGGEYGPFLLSRYSRPAGEGASDIYFLMSTWNPYQVVLMKAQVRR